MACTSAPRSSLSSVASRISTAASNLCSDNLTLLTEIRKSLGIIKNIAVDLEKARRSDKVKELEKVFLELLESHDNCTHLSEAILRTGQNYQNSDQPTDFRKHLEDEVEKLKKAAPFVPLESRFYRQFKEAIWNVHHEGQPMPGEEQEDIVMTSTQSILLNMTCPLTGKPIVELENPIRSMDCKHVYEKDPVMHYIISKKPKAPCPVAGCPKFLQEERVICDPCFELKSTKFTQLLNQMNQLQMSMITLKLILIET
ncbi:E3 SUMO-protein ligase MMS21 [Platanthera zijinensis]|uniref:E3 SUMO-protein ligase MMS21 n=1 Tax=Platanthera zijinensis TaxID=2320716 RepID=A0AAP0BXF0_9ASPA